MRYSMKGSLTALCAVLCLFVFHQLHAGAVTYTYDNAGKLTRIEDRNGNALTLTYTGNDLNQVSDGLGRALSFTYTSGKLTEVLQGLTVAQSQTARGIPFRCISFSYTGDNLSYYTNARGNTTTYSYTKAGGLVGLMTSKTRPEGNTPYTQTDRYPDIRLR